jgi:uncharacterized protein YmfQ (DUF2313 family)
MLFKALQPESQTQVLADFMPNDRLFINKNIDGTNLRALLQGLGFEFFRTELLFERVYEEYDPRTTTELITEWEKLLGIPDGCISISTDIETRRSNVILKLTALGIQTVDDFITLAERLGYEITIDAGADFGLFTFVFPITLFDNAQQARFAMRVNINLPPQEAFTYTFPLTFGVEKATILECFFQQLKPANVKIIFNYNG